MIGRIQQQLVLQQQRGGIDDASAGAFLTEYPLLSFEKSPSYLLFRHIPVAIRTTVPWSRILLLLRNPVERLLSQYRMELKLGSLGTTVAAKRNLTSTACSSASSKDTSSSPLLNTTECLQDILSAELKVFVNEYSDDGGGADNPNNQRNSSRRGTMTLTLNNSALQKLGRIRRKVSGGLDNNDATFSVTLKDAHAFCESSTECFLQRGMYGVQLQYWLEQYQLFPAQQQQRPSMLVLPYELFRAHPQAVYDYVLSFLGLPPFELDETTLREHYVNEIEEALDRKHRDPDVSAGGAVGDGDEEYASIRSFLEDFYRPYNDRLVTVLGDVDWRGIWDSAADETNWMERWLAKLENHRQVAKQQQQM